MERRVMLRMDISTLRLAELRSLLMTARARGRDALAEQIEAEIASRAGGRPAEPRTFETDEVLPIDPEPPEFGASEFEAPPPEAGPPFAFETDDASPIEFGSAPDDFVFRPSKADSPPARRWPIGLAVAGVLTAGVAATWGLNGASGLLPGQHPPAAPIAVAASPSPAPRAMTVRTAAPPPVVAEDPEPPPTAEAKAEPARDPPSRLDPCATPPSLQRPGAQPPGP